VCIHKKYVRVYYTTMRRARIVTLILILVALTILYRTRQSAPAPDGKQWTVYGTMGCGWTRKQLDHMKKNGKHHRFVDCDTEECSGMDAYPTLVSPNGEKIVGFKEV
jgi:hypothetical protein